MEKKKILLQVNMITQCNVNCPRCYLTEEARRNKSIIPIEYLHKTLSDPYFHSDNAQVVLVFIGGEASLIGEVRLREAMEYVSVNFPDVIITMVTNAYSSPDWIFKLVEEYCNGVYETTFALGHKYSLDGSNDKYQDRFIKSMKKAVNRGLDVIINFELNIESLNAGPKTLIDIARETGVTQWEFDHSIQFDQFHACRIYNEYHYPVLTSTIPYRSHSEFLISLLDDHSDDIKELGIRSGVFDTAKNQSNTLQFNTKESSYMIAISPNGDVHTNVFWTSMPEMVIGNLKTETISDMLNHPTRVKNEVYETQHRILDCLSCDNYQSCQGGPSSIAAFDGSGECAGMKMLYNYLKNNPDKYT